MQAAGRVGAPGLVSVCRMLPVSGCCAVAGAGWVRASRVQAATVRHGRVAVAARSASARGRSSSLRLSPPHWRATHKVLLVTAPRKNGRAT